MRDAAAPHHPDERSHRTPPPAPPRPSHPAPPPTADRKIDRTRLARLVEETADV